MVDLYPRTSGLDAFEVVGVAAVSDGLEPDVWECMAALRPRLVEHISWHANCFRGRVWYLLRDQASGRTYHFTPSARDFVARLNGDCRVDEALCLASPDGDLPESEAVDLLSRLQAADLLRLPTPADPQALFERWRTQRHKARMGTLMRPLAMRFSLFDPSRLLDRSYRWLQPLFGRTGFVLWLLLISVAGVLALSESDALIAHARLRFLDPLNLLLLWVLYPLIKAMHEFGHAYAIRVWGGAVREMGVMLLVFVPVPYVEASAATVFPQKMRRVVVGAAGIMVESALAALALLVWLNVQPGLVSDVAFNVAVIGGVSTLLFNGNPLLRFDGYYVLADLLEIPNLATRSQAYYAYLIQHYGLRLSDAVSPVHAKGERAWFIIYGAASSLYRIFISLVIALYVAGKAFIVGTLLACWVVISQLLMPLLRHFRFLLGSPRLRGRRGRALGLVSLVMSAILLTFWYLPLPLNTVADGVVLLPSERIVRAAESGEVVRLEQSNGAKVRAETPLLLLRDEMLDLREKVLAAKVEELQARMQKESFSDRVESSIFRDQVAEYQSELREVRKRHQDLQVRSPADGRLELLNAADLPGRFVRKGDILGVISAAAAATARVVVPHQDVEKIRAGAHRILARYAGLREQLLEGGNLSEVPTGTFRLPSPLLGSQGGGRIAIDSNDSSGLTALQPVFHFDVTLPPVEQPYLPGARVVVRFEHRSEPLAQRWYRSLRQLFLDRLGS